MDFSSTESLEFIRRRLVALGFFVVGATAFLQLLRFALLDDSGIVQDLHVYFASSRWVVESGRLYVDFPSEYPLVANLWFALPRSIAQFFGGGVHLYSMAYVIAVALIYSAFLYHAASLIPETRPRAEIMAILLASLSPELVQLVLLRYDFLPALFVFYALYQLRNGRDVAASLLLGLAIAAKGYPLAYAPAFVVYIASAFNFKTALRSAILVVLPAACAFALTWGFAGYDGMMSPLLFHARRHFDADSVYQLLVPFFDDAVLDWGMGYAVKLGAAGLALVGALMTRRADFKVLARVMLFQSIGLLVLSPISSPQFIIWALPMIYFIADRRLAVLFCGFVLFSNFWIVREFGLPEVANRTFWLTNLALKFWILFHSGRLAIESGAGRA